MPLFTSSFCIRGPAFKPKVARTFVYQHLHALHHHPNFLGHLQNWICKFAAPAANGTMVLNQGQAGGATGGQASQVSMGGLASSAGTPTGQTAVNQLWYHTTTVYALFLFLYNSKLASMAVNH